MVEVDSWQSDSSQSFPNMGLDSIAIQLKKRKKAIVKAILYLALLIAYIRVYLIEECLTYISGRTTLSSLTEKVEFIEAPHIILCIQEPFYFKPSILQKYGLSNDVTSESVILNTENVLLEDQWKMYQNLSYSYQKDFKLQLKIVKNMKDRFGKEIQFKVQRVATLQKGMCHLIRYNESVSTDNDELKIRLKWTLSTKVTKQDFPDSVNVYLNAPKDWYGHIVDDWPMINPDLAMFPMAIKNLQDPRPRGYATLFQTDYHYKEGILDFEECLMNQITKLSKCPRKCFPVLFNFLPDIPICSRAEESNCMLDVLMKSRKIRYDCLQAKKITQFKGSKFYTSGIPPFLKSNETGFIFEIFFDRTRIVKTEEWIVTTLDLIGSVGGSLGLFLGFSVFTYLSEFIDKIIS